MIQFVVQHPIVILYLAAGWFTASIISAMPPLKEGAGFFATWAYNVAQIIGASLDKVGKAAVQSSSYQQAKNTLETTDLSGIKKIQTAETTTATAVIDPKQ